MGGIFSTGRAVNNQGQVAGITTFFLGDVLGFQDHIFVSALGPSGPLVRDLGPGIGLGINNSGQVTGRADGLNGGTGAFLSGSSGGPLRLLGTLPGGGLAAQGVAVNNLGQVAGTAGLPNNITHAFLSGPNGGPLRDMGTLPGDYSSGASKVNSQGQVVGFSTGSGLGITGARAFLFSNGVMTDLNTLINPASGVYLDGADGISDTGFITVHSISVEDSGDGPTFLNHAYLLIPNGPVNDGPKLTLTAQAGPLQNGQRQITAALKNTGGDAGSVQVTQVSLSGASATTTPLPTAAASLPASGSLTRIFTFPVPVGFTHGVFKVHATFTNAATGQLGTFDGSFRI